MMIQMQLLAETGTQNNWKSTVMLLVLLAVFVVMMVVSNMANKKRQKQAQEMKDKIVIGDKVRSIGGIVGEVVSIDRANNLYVICTAGSNIAINIDDVYPIEAFNQNAGRAAEPVFEQNAEEEAPASEEAPAAEEEAPVSEEAPAAEEAQAEDIEE